jgi:electron transfer flavoprotein alpha subunit
MAVLVLLDYDATGIKQPSRSAVTAAALLGEVHGLVAGEHVGGTAEAAAKVSGVSKVLVADGPAYAHALAEPLADLLVSLAGDYTHVLAAATAVGKNVLPRVAALLDSQPISDISGVVDADTFIRPIYAGNALATVKSSDAKKFITVRASSFVSLRRRPPSRIPEFERVFAHCNLRAESVHKRDNGHKFEWEAPA